MLRSTLVVLLTLLPQGQEPRPAAAPQQPAAPKADAKDVATVASTVAALYETISGPAGQPRDWQRLRSLFHDGAHLVPMLPDKDGGAKALQLSVEDYVQKAGPSLQQGGFFEHEIAQRSETFGDFAHVWSTYEGRRGKDDKEPFLRGINSIQLVREHGRWFVLQIVWQQEHDAGAIPAQYLPK